ncbi:uncharacterized protein [Solanum tuberosum]|uniref:uncharacterized protein n=1 Tax=Solanum tuberosum TaxID=4113 RepID=UPI00073A1F4A|nr:PREDICTED: uncharacterized protein LOC107058199 [Solanum tuberosum]
MFHPELVTQIEAEVNKIIEDGFIQEVKYPLWISNIVHVKKKNGQIRVCVNFRDLNNACPKDDFPLPIIELMVDATTGHEAMSFMDGSSGYNQVIMSPKPEEYTKDAPFHWDQSWQNAFERIKGYLLNSPVLGVPTLGKPLILYIASQKRLLGALLAQENEAKKEQTLYYLSRTLIGAEFNYMPIEKICEGAILANFLADHPLPGKWETSDEFPNEDAFFTEELLEWMMFFDGSLRRYGAGAGVVLISPERLIFPFSFVPGETCSNNAADHHITVRVVGDKDWRKPLIQYLEHGRLLGDPRIRADIKRRAPRFIFHEGILLCRSYEGLFLQCLDKEEAQQIMEEAHSGTCGAHQSGPKLHFHIRRMGYYWLTMVIDYLEHAKKCQACKFHANYIHQSPEALHPTVASWPLNAWGLDVIGPLPKSSKGQMYILAASAISLDRLNLCH